MGEYIRNTATVNIIDSDRKYLFIRVTLLISFNYTPGKYIQMCSNAHLNAICVPNVHCTELEINFQESYYIVNEGDRGGSIILRLKEVQNSFTMTLHPVSITEARNVSHFNVSAFVVSVPPEVEATPGKEVINKCYIY